MSLVCLATNPSGDALSVSFVILQLLRDESTLILLLQKVVLIGNIATVCFLDKLQKD